MLQIDGVKLSYTSTKEWVGEIKNGNTERRKHVSGERIGTRMLVYGLVTCRRHRGAGMKDYCSYTANMMR